MNVFDILGPIMVGPSSSHTAGAVKIGLVARKLLQEKPISATIFLHGSFASTGVGHGTDKALIAGLLGMQPDNTDIPNSFLTAKEQGLLFTFSTKTIQDAAPNTALLQIEGENGKTLALQASSVGGGCILVNKLNGISVNFTTENPTLIVQNEDSPGIAAEVTAMLSKESVNIAAMRIYRDRRGGYAVMIIETDEEIPKSLIQCLEILSGILKVTYLNIN